MRASTSAMVNSHRILHSLAVAAFVCVLVLNGTYFRNRETVTVPTADWYVLARLVACTVAFLVGIVLIPKNVRWGFGGKIALLYVLAAWTSVINTPYRVTVVGYAILLSGASTLMLALVYYARNVADLERIQRIWGLTVGALVIKDTLTALFFMDLPSSATEGRLGMGVTHATELSLFAAILFWLSCESPRRRCRPIAWAWRIFLLYVIIAAKSRVSVVSFLIGGLCYLFFGTRDYLKRYLIISCTGLLVISVLFGLSFGQVWASDFADYMKRGQNMKELTSVTGRTYIWKHILARSRESPIIGNGYGVSRLTMGKVPEMTWEPPHCHNEMLQVLFETGLAGLVPFIAMIAYTLKWVKDSARLQRVFSQALARHAVCLIAMLIVSFMFEIRLSGKLSPVQPLFFFYLMILDREGYFLGLNSKQRVEGASCATPTARLTH